MTVEQPVEIPEPGGGVVRGALALPDPVAGVVIFAHGSGSSRHSPRNRMVAAHLNDQGLATLLMDLLTDEEDQVDAVTREHRLDIDLLAERLGSAAAWVAEQPATEGLPLGFFGASTGAAAALVAAAHSPRPVAAVVSRGGRPDLAGDALAQVEAPTLLVVGGHDDVVIGLNEQAYERLRSERRLEIVPGATHLFEEPGALERVARLAGEWFVHQVAAVAHRPPGPGRP